MIDPNPSEVPPARRVDDLPRMLQALREAVQEALRMHKRSGNPVAIWRDGRVQWIAPGDIPLEPVPREDR